MQTIIDLSHYQTVTNWQILKNEVDAIILKATQGHALSGKGNLFTDSAFHEYARACVREGIPFGVYHFFTGSTVKDAIREADYLATVIEPYQNKVMYAVCDAENYGNRWLLGLTKGELSENITAFCRRMEAYGYTACHYTNTDHIQSYIDLAMIPYPVWQAHYARSRPTHAKDKLLLWQYTNQGKIGGIRGNVDCNRGYIPEAEFAIMKLGAMDVIDSPMYWRRAYEKMPYLDLLLTRAAGKIKRSGKPCADLDTALGRLSTAGIIDTPEYWRENAPRMESLDRLIMKLGGAL